MGVGDRPVAVVVLVVVPNRRGVTNVTTDVTVGDKDIIVIVP